MATALPCELWIDGQWRPARSGRRFAVTNPATGALVAEVAEGAKADIDDAVQSARRAFEPWSGKSGAERVAYEEYTQIQNVVVNLSEAPFDWYADDAHEKRYS